MIKIIYGKNGNENDGKTIMRLPVKLRDYDPYARTWNNVDYYAFKRWLCDKYGLGYRTIEWRAV